MDNLTHALVGVTISRLATGNNKRSPVWWAFLAASEMPDFDVLYMLQGQTSYLINHRGATHSLPGLAVTSLLVALIVFRFSRGSRFMQLLLASSAASAAHVTLDILTSWGTGIFHPFDRGWVALDVLPMIDPVFLAALFTGLVIARFTRQQRRMAAAVLIFLILFTAARGTLHAGVKEKFYQAGGVVNVLALPALSPTSWRVVIEREDSVETGRYDLNKDNYKSVNYLLLAGAGDARMYSSDVRVDEVLRFFRIPVFSKVRKDGEEMLLLRDMTYGGGIREVILNGSPEHVPNAWYRAIK
ncbi:MAG: metal-dependent hydrolase [Eubacteriales bacterium]